MGQDYDRDQVRSIVEPLGVEVALDTGTNLLCYCPFHTNTHTPAFSIGVENGLWTCFNSSCPTNETRRGGNLTQLVMMLSDMTNMQAIRFVAKRKSETTRPLHEKLAANKEEDFPLFPQLKIDDFTQQYAASTRAQQYMSGRGFTKQTTDDFEVGYDGQRDMIIVPIHDKDGNPIGVNGRSVEGKRFKLSNRMPRNKVLFNMHRAKKAGGTVIVCESQFDVMRIWQTGHKNAVCALGSHVSKEQTWLLQRHFDRMVLMTDNDPAGEKMGDNLSALSHTMRVEWAMYKYGERYPDGAKDAGDMTDDQIRYVINNAVTNSAYRLYTEGMIQ